MPPTVVMNELLYSVENARNEFSAESISKALVSCSLYSDQDFHEARSLLIQSLGTLVADRFPSRTNSASRRAAEAYTEDILKLMSKREEQQQRTHIFASVDRNKVLDTASFMFRNDPKRTDEDVRNIVFTGIEGVRLQLTQLQEQMFQLEAAQKDFLARAPAVDYIPVAPPLSSSACKEGEKRKSNTNSPEADNSSNTGAKQNPRLRLPVGTKTVLIADSQGKRLQQRELDPEGSVRIRSYPGRGFTGDKSMSLSCLNSSHQPLKKLEIVLSRLLSSLEVPKPCQMQRCVVEELEPVIDRMKQILVNVFCFRAKGAFLDGGLCSNNPTMDLLTEMVERNLALKCAGQDGLQELPSIVVSLGTGKNPVIPVETPVDVCRPDSILGAARSASNLQKFFTILIDVCTQTEQSTVDRARAWCYSLGVPYFRLNPPLSEETQLDEQDDAKLALGLWETMVYIRERKDEFEDIARILRSAS
ncbi:unnamed protein product [Cyprideis torosa]|uniref:Uncharacterized protein n=1 Tax=Cyprideis torosa TaxID=163714 RepID=A0A7R8WLE1_9CRUS|nr:unnamed protein product [Cyprideis torosa]CAG0904219.1 unnamed protein product [Cyprideis torosa]